MYQTDPMGSDDSEEEKEVSIKSYILAHWCLFVLVRDVIPKRKRPNFNYRLFTKTIELQLSMS